MKRAKNKDSWNREWFWLSFSMVGFQKWKHDDSFFLIFSGRGKENMPHKIP
ncbi:hypothetical protein [Anaerotignum sp.]|uniref:hypothetical protein n=1 Tax=Anaerotignum sp. TaxID=2039241 RepID=UPI002A90FFC3|nr:hypothetical protein [Anaerotignum sp.]MCI7658229.1 hypothetical protein [Clostridia bacterium]MDY5416269.1 hypothetical protein [Anaerotignum sp.]